MLQLKQVKIFIEKLMICSFKVQACQNDHNYKICIVICKLKIFWELCIVPQTHGTMQDNQG